MENDFKMSNYQHAAATSANEALFRREMLVAVARLRGEVLVDLGAGNGQESVALARQCKAKTVICVDHDPKELARANKLKIKAVKADLNQPIPLADNLADVVIANQVIEHIAKTDTLVKEIERILRPGGRAIICTPNLASWHNIAALVMGWQPFSSQVSDAAFLGNPLHPLYKQAIQEEQAHLRVFTRRSLTDLLGFHGLEIDEARGIGFYPFRGGLAKQLARLDPSHAAYILVQGRKPKR
jgi:ubiquinone/menaquinone biosynthesis C-methylase UbiE